MMPNTVPHKLTILSLSLVILIDSLTMGLVIPIFAALFSDPHGIVPLATSVATRNLMYSMIISLPMLALLLGSPILGVLSDRWDRKIVLLIGLMGVFISCVLSVSSFYASSVTLLFASRILIGLMDGSQAIAQAAIVDISRPDEKVKNMSLITLAATVGWIVGPVLGGVLADPNICSWFGYKTPFWAAAIIALVNFGLLKFTFAETSTPVQKAVSHWTTELANVIKGFVDKRYLVLSFTFVVIQFSWGVLYLGVNLLLAQQFHYSAAMLGVFSTYVAIIFSIFLLLLLRPLLKRSSNLNITRSGLLLMTIGLAIYAFWAHSELAIWLALIPVGIGEAMTYNTILALFSDSVEPNEQGKVMGITVGMSAIAWLLAGLVTGHFTSISYPVTFAIAAGVTLLGFIILLRYREK